MESNLQTSKEIHLQVCLHFPADGKTDTTYTWGDQQLTLHDPSCASWEFNHRRLLPYRRFFTTTFKRYKNLEKATIDSGDTEGPGHLL